MLHNAIVNLYLRFRFNQYQHNFLIYLLMAESNQIIRFGDGIVDAAKSVKIDPAEFINVDTSQTAIRYKKMAPIVIASRLKTMCDDCEDQEAKKRLRALTAELETAQQYGIDVGKSELIYLASIQSQNTVRFAEGFDKLRFEKSSNLEHRLDLFYFPLNKIDPRISMKK